MNTNKRKISILGAVLVFICLFSSCVRDKVRNSIAMDKESDSIVIGDTIVIDLAKEPVVMDMDMVRFGPSVNCACDTNIRYSDSDEQE